jgi:hypothetical protein
MTHADDLPANFLLVSIPRRQLAPAASGPLHWPPCMCRSGLAAPPFCPPCLKIFALPHAIMCCLQGNFDELVGYEEECAVPEPEVLPGST